MIRQPAVRAILACAALLVGGPAQLGWGEPVKVQPAELAPGMSQKEVIRLRGQPHRRARQILYRRYLEQWVYDEPNAVRIEFDCVRGQEPRILTVQRLTVPQP